MKFKSARVFYSVFDMQDRLEETEEFIDSNEGFDEFSPNQLVGKVGGKSFHQRKKSKQDD